MKIGLLKEGFDVCDEEVSAAVRNVALRLTEAGASVEDITIPVHKDGKLI